MKLYSRKRGESGDTGSTRSGVLATAAATVVVFATIAIILATIMVRGFGALVAQNNAGSREGEALIQQPVGGDVDPFLPDNATGYKAPPAPSAVPWTAGQTVVSLTFDDGTDSQLQAANLMAQHGFSGTFFINSGSIGKPGYLTFANLRTIAEQGHEIGGHGVSHRNMSTLPPAEVKREICGDRATLSDLGFNVRNFAYPYAAVNNEVRPSALECGYNTARGLGGVRTRFSCPDCPWAESVPPPVTDFTAAPAPVSDEWTLEDLKDTVRSAQPSGGWVQLTFHRICTSDCDRFAVKESMLTEFLAWLQSQTQSTPTFVHSVERVIGGPTQPLVDAPADRDPPAPGENGVANASLDEVGDLLAAVPLNVAVAGAVPRCWQPNSYGNHQATFEAVSPGRSDDLAMFVQVTNYSDGEANLLPVMDLGHCAPEVAPGRIYNLAAWYKSTAPTQFSVHYRLDRGAWVYWTSSTFFSDAEEYTEARWTTPPIPEGVTAISFGLGLVQNGTLTTDDYALTEVQGERAG